MTNWWLESARDGQVPPIAGRTVTLSAHAHLARAYLAIADDPESPAVQRSPSRVLCSVLAAVVLALAAPLAWTSAPTGKPLDLPAATAVKGGGSAEDDEDADDDAGDPWAATHA
jgi:hypothetical protein